MDFGLISSDEQLTLLLKRIKMACRDAKAGTIFEEFIIVRKRPFMPGGGPRVEFIRGVVPQGFTLHNESKLQDTCKKAKPRKRKKSSGKR
jgi:hypothetical protein